MTPEARRGTNIWTVSLCWLIVASVFAADLAVFWFGGFVAQFAFSPLLFAATFIAVRETERFAGARGVSE